MNFLGSLPALSHLPRLFLQCRFRLRLRQPQRLKIYVAFRSALQIDHKEDSLGSFRKPPARSEKDRETAMKFKSRNLRALAEMVIGDNTKFRYRSSSYITQFFEECDIEFAHDGSTRWAWASDRLAALLSEPTDAPNTLPPRFVHVLRVLMQKADAAEDDPNREIALA